MIRIVTLDKLGQPAVIENVETVTLTGDVIILNPGLPDINTPQFDAWLAEWHSRCSVILSLDKSHQAAQHWRPYRSTP